MKPIFTSSFASAALLISCLSCQQEVPPAAPGEMTGYESYAPFTTETEAMRRGAELGVGKAEIIGPAEFVVDSHAEIRLRFTAGQAGMKTGGGLRIATAHGFRFDMWGGAFLQTSKPRAENYLSFESSSGSELEWTAYSGGGGNELFAAYHPWQTINQFLLRGPGLQPGDTIDIVFGDRSQGSPGVRMQQMDEEAFEQRFYVDAFGQGEFLPLPESPRIRVAADDARELNAAAASDWIAGQPAWVNVWLDDGYGNPAERFRGTVRLTVEALEGDLESAASLPPPYTFTAADRGARRFEEISIATPGRYQVVAHNEEDPTPPATSNPFVVHAEAPAEKLYWGDLHTHTMYSDGRGKPAETYDFGKRVSALDFCSVSDHAFVTTDEMWREIGEVTNQFYEPGRYVTFLAYEWSGKSDVGGDHNVYTSDASMPLIRSYSYYNYENLRMYHGPDRGANHVEDLFRRLSEIYRDENILTIPHFGGRQGNPAWHNPKIQRQIEIFSDHRRSEDWASTFLEKGYRVGVMASTDNHSGNAGYGVRRIDVTRGEEGDLYSRFSPAERGTSLIAVYAGELTRESIFQAIYHRRTYATTGSRIILRFTVDDVPMGSVGAASPAPKIAATVIGTDRIRSLRLVKNGKLIHAVSLDAVEADFEYSDNAGASAGDYYYLDVVQEDGEKAISSPVWLE